MAFRRYEYVDKEGWVEEYKKKNPRGKNYYNYVNDKNKEKINFLEKVYHNKCIYCGMDLSKVPLSFCEIDHVVPINENEKLKHEIKNLVCSCRTCNRTKSKNLISEMPHPDSKEFSNYFTRNNKYEIIPTSLDTEKSKEIIIKLGYNKRQHKLTYLYDELNILKDLQKNIVLKYRYQEIIQKLDEVRLREL